MKNTALLLFVVCAANAAIFTSYSNNPGQSSQPSNIWNQPTWNQPSYTPPSSWDNTAQNSDQFPQDTPFVGSSADNSEDDIKKQYSDFKLKNGKSYSATTDNYRYGVFSSNVRKINAHNSDPTQTYKKEVNKFADLTDQQFAAIYLTAKVSGQADASTSVSISSNVPIVSAITPIDWRTSGKLNPIKNQGGCGSCWAFSVVGTVQSNVAIKKGAAPGVYSEQQLVDCCSIYDPSNCLGCNGGWTGSGFDYIGKIGLTTGAQYPYLGAGSTCREASVAKNFYVKSIGSYVGTSGLSNALIYLAKGPVSVILDATLWGSYKTGIMSCNAVVKYNHAVMLVGIQSDGVYIVRNSWGTSWGESGYIRISATSTKNCGILTYLLTPQLL